MNNYNMQPLYEAIGENISSNPQLFGLEKYFNKSNNIVIVGFGSGLSTLLAIRAKPKTITIYDHILHDVADYIELANDMGISLIFKHGQIIDQHNIPDCDLAYIDSLAEGNYVATVCEKIKNSVGRHIIVDNTFKHGHKPDPAIQLGNGAQPIGIIFGINHFLQTNDPWHIAENLYWEPGLTVLYRRRDFTDVQP